LYFINTGKRAVPTLRQAGLLATGSESSPVVPKDVNKRPVGEFFFYGASTTGRAPPKNAVFALKSFGFRIASEEVILKT